VSTTPANPAVLISSLQALTAAQLIDYYPPPAPLSTVLQQPSTDPAVYRDNPDYIKFLNEQTYWKYAVDVPNRWTADRFNFACKQWEQADRTAAGKSPFLPAPPAYVVFDVDAFNQWWTQLVPALQGTGEAPPLFFIKPAALPPPPVILPAGITVPPPPPPATDGPVGAAIPNLPGMFDPGPGDKFPDGYVYAGPTGVYQKHFFGSIANNVRAVWIALATISLPTAA
jgi:hypothetical protein